LGSLGRKATPAVLGERTGEDAGSVGNRMDASDRRPGKQGLLGPRRWKPLAVVAATVIVAFAAITARVLVWPSQESAPAKVDAIVMLAGPGNRMALALKLASEHRAPVLVVSRGWKWGPCPTDPPSGVTVTCFVPNPATTRGEVEYAARLAKRNGWHSMLIVAIRPQAVRARLLMSRCFAGQTYVATAPITWYSWPYQIAYGWGALAKALLVHTSC
jgi:hypothetical protein